MKLDKYRKPDKVEPKATTSVFIERRHLDFVRKYNLNLSLILRECLDKLMGKQRDGPDEK